jgi:hypothetical protein
METGIRQTIDWVAHWPMIRTLPLAYVHRV